ncbi:MAG: ribonuclease Z [bacterium]|nr:ribonuclease Z [bacterium]
MSAPELYILGSSSATPTRDRNPSAQILKFGHDKIMIDCGEGTQMRLIQLGIRHTGLDYICISHLHGDHYFGLIGLISSMNLMGRKNALHIIGPPQLKQIINLQLLEGGKQPEFDIIFHPTNPNKAEVILKTNHFELSTFPLKHQIHCTGFILKEAPKERSLNIENIEKYQVPISFFKNIKAGEDFQNEQGEIIAYQLLSYDPKPSRSYAYCSDTIFDLEIVEHVKNCTVLYHEATYLEALQDKAAERFHSTAEQAGIIAQNAGVDHLIIGHFSSRYDNLDPLLQEAKLVFSQTSLAIEGLKFSIEPGAASEPAIKTPIEFSQVVNLN